MSLISVVIPTMTGREHHLARCVAAYSEHSRHEIELIVLKDRSCCGEAWNEGAERARGEYLHLTADDIEPFPGWDAAAVETASVGYVLPAPVLYKPDGQIETCGGAWHEMLADGETAPSTCVIPFCSIEQWTGHTPSGAAPLGPVLSIHYYSDNHFTDRAKQAGLRFVVRHRYAFTHHWGMEGWGDDVFGEDVKEAKRARMRHDHEVYMAVADTIGPTDPKRPIWR